MERSFPGRFHRGARHLLILGWNRRFQPEFSDTFQKITAYRSTSGKNG
jgi:hypothetical protein